jgi:hypothetical protein
MNKLFQSQIGFLFICLSMPIQADFLGDRCYAKPSSTPSDALDPGITRVYIGKKQTNECLGGTLEQCVKKLGKPGKTERTNKNQLRLTFYGTKNLYRGTGTNNKSIGPEWREVLVVEEKIVDEYSVFQIIEIGYSWDTNQAGNSADISCEQYGECKTMFCSGITPVQPVPQLPKPPEVAMKYTSEEKASLYLQLWTLEICAESSEENTRKTTTLRRRLHESAPALFEMIEASPEYAKTLSAVKLSRSKKPSPTGHGYDNNCDILIDAMTEQLTQKNGPAFLLH